MSKEYEIETVSDFLQLSEDQIPVCLEELKESLLYAKSVQDIIGVLGDNHKPLIEKFTWVDDGEKNKSIKTCVNGEHIYELKVSASHE